MFRMLQKHVQELLDKSKIQLAQKSRLPTHVLTRPTGGTQLNPGQQKPVLKQSSPIPLHFLQILNSGKQSKLGHWHEKSGQHSSSLAHNSFSLTQHLFPLQVNFSEQQSSPEVHSLQTLSHGLHSF
mmetsp:Transcript_32420/g.58623  ORF Transcript_32420/g.58623 Transcript_32420/m.58623 type:complete len:126 (-) Transcript_32420:888-1265(-)